MGPDPCAYCDQPASGGWNAHGGIRLCKQHLDAARRAKNAKRKREQAESRNPYGVDAPLTRMAFALIYVATGALPKDFDEGWKENVPPMQRPDDVDDAEYVSVWNGRESLDKFSAIAPQPAAPQPAVQREEDIATCERCSRPLAERRFREGARQWCAKCMKARRNDTKKKLYRDDADYRSRFTKREYNRYHHARVEPTTTFQCSMCRITVSRSSIRGVLEKYCVLCKLWLANARRRDRRAAVTGKTSRGPYRASRSIRPDEGET